MASGTLVSRTIQAIDEIAFETNLLALHAALGALQSGQTGGMAQIARAVALVQQGARKAAGSPGQGDELALQVTALRRLVDQMRP